MSPAYLCLTNVDPILKAFRWGPMGVYGGFLGAFGWFLGGFWAEFVWSYLKTRESEGLEHLVEGQLGLML